MPVRSDFHNIVLPNSIIMKAATTLLALATVAQAHYSFPSIVSGGTTTTPWQYVRQWTGYYTYSPVQSVSTNDIRCNVGGSTASASGILPVAAGSSISFTADPNIYHPGPALVYMAKVPAGKTAATWDGSGSVWVSNWVLRTLLPQFG